MAGNQDTLLLPLYIQYSTHLHTIHTLLSTQNHPLSPQDQEYYKIQQEFVVTGRKLKHLLSLFLYEAFTLLTHYFYIKHSSFYSETSTKVIVAHRNSGNPRVDDNKVCSLPTTLHTATTEGREQSNLTLTLQTATIEGREQSDLTSTP